VLEVKGRQSAGPENLCTGQPTVVFWIVSRFGWVYEKEKERLTAAAPLPLDLFPSPSTLRETHPPVWADTKKSFPKKHSAAIK